MADLIVENTGLDYLYPDGVPIAEVSLDISEIYKKVARISSLAVHADPYFTRFPETMKVFSELHGEGDRITRDFLEEGARDLHPIFHPMQRWMTDEAPGPTFEFDSVANPGKIIYRWQLMDTRYPDQKLNYTSGTLIDIRIDGAIVENVRKYAFDAMKDYILKELYETIGNDTKHQVYFRSFEQNRAYVAFWAKSDTSLQTGYHHTGV